MKNLNLNADFLLDIWADLKTKRLAPVAVGLVAAVVVMPALMLKGDEAPAEAPLPIMAPAGADTAEVEVAEELAEGGSKLDSYKARDPFDGLVKPTESGSPGASGAAIAPSDLIKDAGGGTPALPSLGSGGGSTGSTDMGGSTDPGGSGGLTPGGGSEPPVVIKRPGARFNYHLDVKFGRPGRETRYPSLARMSFLPSEKLPALLFMGVPVAAKSALFFVHPTLSHAGEGKCIPSRTNCNFLELKIGRDHFLSVNDYEFHIRLLGIKRVKLSAEKRQRAESRKTFESRRAGRPGDDGSDALAGDSGSTGYDWPWLVDGVG